MRELFMRHKKIDWEKMADENFDFACIKATEGIREAFSEMVLPDKSVSK